MNNNLERKDVLKDMIGKHGNEGEKGKKTKCKLLMIKKEDFINILSKYDKALQKFKMISLFRDDYFTKLRSNIKTNFNEGLNLLIKTIEGPEGIVHLHEDDEKHHLLSFLRQRFQSFNIEQNEDNVKEGKTNFTENQSDQRILLSNVKTNKKMCIKKKDILNEITQKFSLMSTNHSKFDDLINEVYVRINGLPFFNQSEKLKYKSST